MEKCFSKLTPQSQGKEADLCSSPEILRWVWLGKPGRAKLSWNGKWDPEAHIFRREGGTQLFQTPIVPMMLKDLLIGCLV